MPIKLSHEHQRRLFKHIQEKWGEHRACPMCGERKWTVDGSVYRLAAMTRDSSHNHSVVQPLATVRCTNCSNVVLIHLTKSGIASPNDLNLGQIGPDLDPDDDPAVVTVSDIFAEDPTDEYG